MLLSWAVKILYETALLSQSAPRAFRRSPTHARRSNVQSFENAVAYGKSRRMLARGSGGSVWSYWTKYEGLLHAHSLQQHAPWDLREAKQDNEDERGEEDSTQVTFRKYSMGSKVNSVKNHCELNMFISAS